MALLSFVDSTPRAYRLKASNAYRPFSTAAGTSPIRTAYKAYTAETIAAFLDGLTEDARRSLDDAFRSHLETLPGATIITTYFAGGESWHTVPVIRAEAVKFLPERCPDFRLPSIADFAEARGTPNFDAIEREYLELSNSS